ncbi:MAG: hypothetical protein ACP5R5_02040 [Armatimonadota bacterium]
MEKRNAVWLSLMALCFFALAGVGISWLMQGSAVESKRQLTQEQRLDVLNKLSPNSDTVRRVVAGESAKKEAEDTLSATDR